MGTYILIQHQFPSLHLEDKVAVGAGGLDKPPIHLTYTRKKRHARNVTPQNEAAYMAAAGQAGGTLGSLILGWGDIKEMGA